MKVDYVEAVKARVRKGERPTISSWKGVYLTLNISRSWCFTMRAQRKFAAAPILITEAGGLVSYEDLLLAWLADTGRPA
jgi:hypothetical protein